MMLACCSKLFESGRDFGGADVDELGVRPVGRHGQTVHGDMQTDLACAYLHGVGNRYLSEWWVGWVNILRAWLGE
jgi:hypothetical protein